MLYIHIIPTCNHSATKDIFLIPDSAHVNHLPKISYQQEQCFN